MDIKEFVAATLTQIVEGAAASADAISRVGGAVNPPTLNTFKSDGTCIGDTHTGALVFAVDFDIAVTVTATTETNAGARLQVASLLNLGAGGKSGDANQSTSRVKFRVPIALPLDAKMRESRDAEIKQEQEARDRAMSSHRGSGSWMA